MLGAAFVYGLPLALISTELASAMPFDGGAVAWVEEAFGTGLGAHNTYWLWVCYSLDAAIYPVFAAEYIVQHWDVWGLHYEKYAPHPAQNEPRRRLPTITLAPP